MGPSLISRTASSSNFYWSLWLLLNQQDFFTVYQKLSSTSISTAVSCGHSGIQICPPPTGVATSGTAVAANRQLCPLMVLLPELIYSFWHCLYRNASRCWHCLLLNRHFARIRLYSPSKFSFVLQLKAPARQLRVWFS
ncbi:hypothetical protein CS542_00340 [Pedobacter sp. IW39]|nr:hypothetical protein CS542_00340 [Pedobacter sp. IW39]